MSICRYSYYRSRRGCLSVRALAEYPFFRPDELYAPRDTLNEL